MPLADQFESMIQRQHYLRMPNQCSVFSIIASRALCRCQRTVIGWLIPSAHLIGRRGRELGWRTTGSRVVALPVRRPAAAAAVRPALPPRLRRLCLVLGCHGDPRRSPPQAAQVTAELWSVTIGRFAGLDSRDRPSANAAQL